MRIHVFLLAIALSLPACAQQGKFRLPAAAGHDPAAKGWRFPDALLLAQSEGTEDVEMPAARPSGPSADKAPKLPANNLSRELLYKFLLAEIAGQRGNIRLASRAYLELAQATKDPRVARRATEIAMYGRFNDIAAEAASVWLEIEPDSQQARQTLIATLLGNNRLADAKPLLQKLLAADKSRTGALFLQLNPILGRHPDKTASLNLVKELAAAYPGIAESHVAVAQAAFAAGSTDLARAEATKALEINPALEAAALLNAQILQRESAAGAAEYLGGFVAANPNARDARLYYGRLLAADKRPAEARREFERLEREVPGNPEIVLMVGLLSLQMQDTDTAKAKLERALELNYRDPDTVRFYLGQIAEERRNDAEALAQYEKVQSGDQAVPAASRYALILARQQKFEEARAHLRGVRAQNDQQRTLLTQAEAQVLREAKQYQEAFDVVSSALEGQPDNPDLLYDVAMAAEKVDRIDILETRLKRLIELRPDHAQAYNALGYTLADRNLRLAEARAYIEKALQLAPEDAFILDSMGWVHYRLGNLDLGLDYLKRAFKVRQDPEIAAHLGEILWAKGQKGEAEKLLRSALQNHPSNEELQATVRKFLQ